MAQPNLAREPSMDEILASIRKIIENNEFGTPVITEEHDIPGENDDIRLTVEDDLGEFAASLEQDDDMHKGTYSYEPAAQPERVVVADTASQPSAPKSMSLADVAARVRAASEQRISQAISGHEPVSPMPVRVSEPATRIGVTQATTVASTVAETQSQPLQARDLAVSGEKEQAPIMSPEVGEKVSRAFETLSVAVDGGTRRSFDDIAEEMMRPMLQDWLDDNLPKLVERLVREEIERVARGPRR
jgi:uncharacterized protein